jgi:hypothetical protein
MEAMLVDVVDVFGAIRFYTQGFGRRVASPATVLPAGLLPLDSALGLRRPNAGPGEAA